MINRFPEGFLWGAATSAHQVEGNNTNSDWWRAEQKGGVPYKSGRACDSYHRYEEDFDLAKKMHNNAHRLSLEWARIEPNEGEFDEKEIEHYRAVLRALKERGLEPFITLHHFTNPAWFADKGGWKSSKAPYYFERYARYVAEHLGNEATYWMTLNEPNVLSSAGYLSGRWLPQKKWRPDLFIRSMRHMVQAHNRAAKSMRSIIPTAKIGIAKNDAWLIPAPGWSYFFNRLLVPPANYMRNGWFLGMTKHNCDFLGLNFYNTYYVHILKVKYQPPDAPRNDSGWAIVPEGIYHVAKRWHKRYRLPIYITENGLSDVNDDKRVEFIRDHARWLHRAIIEGAGIRGYFYWSLLDNFEWLDGFTKKFGLVAVDFSTQKRTPRKSATIYSNFCEQNAVN